LHFANQFFIKDYDDDDDNVITFNCIKTVLYRLSKQFSETMDYLPSEIACRLHRTCHWCIC